MNYRFLLSICGRVAPGASTRARLGAVSFVHRFGAALNRHARYPCCVLDGLFEPLDDGQVQFRQALALTPLELIDSLAALILPP